MFIDRKLKMGKAKDIAIKIVIGIVVVVGLFYLFLALTK